MADDHSPPAAPRDELDTILAKIPPMSEAQYQAELEEPIAYAENQAEADRAAGRFISSGAVTRWLDRSHTDHPPPRPQCGE